MTALEASRAPSRRRPVYTTAVRNRLDPSFLRASRVLGYAQAVGNMAAYFALLLLAARASSPWQSALLFLGIGLMQHRLFFPTHDCIHYALFPTRAENHVVGTILSGLLGTSFEAIRDQHLEHHRKFGAADDPGAPDYYVRFESRAQLLRFMLSPIVGGILVAKARDYLLRPSGRGQAAAATAQQPDLKAAGVRYGALLAVQALVAVVLTRGFQVHELWRYPVFNVVPAVTVFLFLNRLRMFLEHGSLDYSVCDYLEGRRPTARTVYGSWAERVFIVGSDFNYHHEHHLYPAVPGWQLPRLHKTLKAAGLDEQDVRRTYVGALAEIWATLK